MTIDLCRARFCDLMFESGSSGLPGCVLLAETLSPQLQLVAQCGDIAMVLLQPGGEVAALRQRDGDAFRLQINQRRGGTGVLRHPEPQLDRRPFCLWTPR